MDSSPDFIIKEIPGILRLYADGTIQKLGDTTLFPAGHHPATGVLSKDVLISPPATTTNLSVRLYIPRTTNSDSTLPLLIYFHGGGFIIGTTATTLYHNFLNLVAAESNVVIVSVDYGTAPEHPVPTCYHDSWEAIQWVAQHVNGTGPDPWLNEVPDFRRVFLAGDSAGGNIAHHMATRFGSENPSTSITLNGMILLHPYFLGKDPIGSELEHPWKTLVRDVWMFAHPGTSGLDDPLINPAMDPKVADLGCSRVLVCVAEKDILKGRGWNYKDILFKNGWKGDIDVIEDKGEGHVFFLFNTSSDNACTLRKRICTFINAINN